MVNREMIEEVKRLWVEGMSALEIAAQLGCTKNSVIGRVHRMKLAPREAVLRPRQRAQEGKQGSRRPKPKKEAKEVVVAKLKRAPNEPPKTKGELRAMLAEAWRNTALI